MAMEMSGEKKRRQPKRMAMSNVRAGMWGVDVTAEDAGNRRWKWMVPCSNL